MASVTTPFRRRIEDDDFLRAVKSAEVTQGTGTLALSCGHVTDLLTMTGELPDLVYCSQCLHAALDAHVSRKGARR